MFYTWKHIGKYLFLFVAGGLKILDFWVAKSYFLFTSPKALWELKTCPVIQKIGSYFAEHWNFPLSIYIHTDTNSVLMCVFVTSPAPAWPAPPPAGPGSPCWERPPVSAASAPVPGSSSSAAQPPFPSPASLPACYLSAGRTHTHIYIHTNWVERTDLFLNHLFQECHYYVSTTKNHWRLSRGFIMPMFSCCFQRSEAMGWTLNSISANCK